jgi:hypothetical protein
MFSLVKTVTISRATALLGATVLLVNLTASYAMAADGGGTPGREMELKLWAAVAGLLVPIGGYALNRVLPTTSEMVKASTHVVLAAVAGAIVELADLGSIGFDVNTLYYLLSAGAAAFASHVALWRPATVNARLGGPENAIGYRS